MDRMVSTLTSGEKRTLDKESGSSNAATEKQWEAVLDDDNAGKVHLRIWRLAWFGPFETSRRPDTRGF